MIDNNNSKKITDEIFLECYNRLKDTGHGSRAKMAKELDLDPSTITQRINRGQKSGKIPLDSGVSVQEGTALTGISRYHKLADGGIWVKTNVEKEQYLKSVQEVLDKYTNGLQEVYVPKEIPQFSDNNMTTFYPLPDLHFGLLINRNESSHGKNFDLKVETEWVLGAQKHLVDSSPNSKYAVIADHGDFLHAMDDRNQTKSGHSLDVDGRHSKIVECSFAIVVQLIEMALQNMK